MMDLSRAIRNQTQKPSKAIMNWIPLQIPPLILLYKTKQKTPRWQGFSARKTCGEVGIRTHEQAINPLLP